MDLNLALIICTRNRPQMLSVLLDSIELSETKPNSVVVVSSGDDISKVIQAHQNSLQLRHHHTSKIGQSNQKLIAIQMLDQHTNWVFFLDDLLHAPIASSPRFGPRPKHQTAGFQSLEKCGICSL